jgi:adenine-specific DNA-methyltransferase
MNSQKKTGSFYTPPALSRFLIHHIFNNYSLDNDLNILEPSCGDGQFLMPLLKEKVLSAHKNVQIDFLDINKEELRKAEEVCTQNKRGEKINLHPINEDFLDFQEENRTRYSLIIGNPPYIKKNYLTQDQIEKCREIYNQAGLRLNNVKNIWPAFLLGSIMSLDENGILCFVLPSEFLQVNYTKELRNYILTQFHRIEIFAFNQLIFDGIEQDVIVFIGSKNTAKQGLSFYQVGSLDDLKEIESSRKFNNVHRKTLDKWTNYILSDEELKFVENLRKDLEPIKNYCEKVEVGIVTAANKYFVVNEEVVKENNLNHFVKTLIPKGSFTRDRIRLTKQMVERIRISGKPVNFIHFNDENPSNLDAHALEYIRKGEEQYLDKRFKCNLRKHWYHVPSVWASDGMFIKRTHLYPRVLINDAGVYVTDSFYRINMKSNFKIADLVFSFYNTLTFVLAELEGRYYGGGVLELTPNEFKNLSIPFYESVSSYHLSRLEGMIENKADIEIILNFTDGIILKHTLGLSESEIERLRAIYKKLVSRRLKKPINSMVRKRYVPSNRFHTYPQYVPSAVAG